MNSLAISKLLFKIHNKGNKPLLVTSGKGNLNARSGVPGTAKGPLLHAQPALCKARGTTVLLKAAPGMEKPPSLKLSLSWEGEYKLYA